MSDDYSELPRIIGEMKRAAADSYMAAQGWFVEVTDDTIYSLWGFLWDSAYERPEPDGSGGGDACGWVNFAAESMASTFDNLRGQIDTITGPWTDLPDGSLCEAPRNAAALAAGRFGASGASASVEANAELAEASSTMNDKLNIVIKGAFTVPFQDKYSTQFSLISVGLGIACAIIELNYDTQQKIWPAAQDDVVALFVGTREALREDARQSAAEFGQVALTAVAVIGGAAATIATAGAAVGLVVAAVTVAGAASIAARGLEAHATITGADCWDILGSLDTALGTLNTGITEIETTLNSRLQDTITAMESEPAYFNLDAFPISYPGVTDDVAMTQTDALSITTKMDRVVTVLEGAKSTLGSGPSSNPTVRDSFVGISASGTFSYAHELHQLTAQCLNATAAEYARGEELFKATVDDFFSTDEAVAAIANSLAADEALTNGA